MDERLRFVEDAHRPGWSIAELCRRYGVSRKTGYKWLAIYGRCGAAGLADTSRRPLSCPHATPPTVVRLILQLQQRYTWGARKVRRLLRARVPAAQVPTKTTIHRILERHGRVKPRRAPRRRFHQGPPGTPMDRPNAVWTADFKGQFRTGNGVYCYPLTVQDGASRFLLGCRGLLEPTIEASRPVFERLFRRYGLPVRLRTDNGAPFASNALGRLSTLSVWWVELGIRPELIEPAHPEQNGRHERMHKTLKAATARPTAGGPGGAAAALRLVPAPVQHRAAPRSTRRRDTGELLRARAATVPHAAPRGRLPRPLRAPAREPQRRHSLGASVGERESLAGGTGGRLRGNR